MRAKSILAADSDRSMRSALFTALTRLGYAVELAEDVDETLAKARSMPFDLAICDLKLHRGGGAAMVKELKSLRPALPIIVMSGGGGVEEAVGAMREGAQDYLLKPFTAEAVEEAAGRAFAKVDLDASREEPPGGQDGAAEGPGPAGVRPIVCRSVVMNRLLALARNLAGSSATVLLQGESGTGKELLARYVHNMSPRVQGPFVAVNCAGLPESLLESELFGHEKGAFTGALNRKAGKFDLASGGTLLLDEISEMDISLQAKLLRALQEGEIDPVGGKGPHKVDVRVIATTNRRLKDWVDEGRFRADLYYRLNVMPFFIPSLRERREDIEPLCDHFLAKYASQNGRNVKGFSDEAMDALNAHDWPGNIRELENTIARAVLMTVGETVEAQDIFMDEAGFLAALEKNSLAAPAPESGGVQDGADVRDEPVPGVEDEGDWCDAPGFGELPGGPGTVAAEGQAPRRDGEGFTQGPAVYAEGLHAAAMGTVGAAAAGAAATAAAALFGSGGPILPVMTIDQMERKLIGRALDETAGNRTHAAKLLGISVRTLRNKLNEYRNGALQESSAAAG
ncbi:MAG: sigma-54 dependent transcriptional regulator [Deltaproteobacteria bacterium]|jgi:two-component system response regulator FlrC|nr:sigma-54 dependent transcriptional regulator [Deltaproteobacteria bacterium]